MSDPMTDRWVSCPLCQAPAEHMAVALLCTGPACRLYDERAYQAWAAEGSPLWWQQRADRDRDEDGA